MHRMISETAQSWHKIRNVETTDLNLMFYGLLPMKMRYRFRNTRIPSDPVKLWRSTNKFLEFGFPFNTWFMKLCYIFHMMIHLFHESNTSAHPTAHLLLAQKIRYNHKIKSLQRHTLHGL